jgi:hypothetical protein
MPLFRAHTEPLSERAGGIADADVNVLPVHSRDSGVPELAIPQ